MTSSSSAKTLPDTLNKHWKNDKSGFGYRMLQKMGWKEDKGLGREESGIVDAIRVKKREQGLALGANEVDYREAGWNATAAGFSEVLGLLQKEYCSDRQDQDGEAEDEEWSKKDKKKKKKEKKKDRKKADRAKKPKRKHSLIQVGMK